jgi:8-oxo-dGTP diphosphatase
VTQEPETTVAAIITDKDSSGTKILLTQRGPELRHFPGQWCLPGGHIDAGELWSEAIHREIKEETDLDFRPRFFASFDEVVPEYDLHHMVKVFEGCGIGEPQIQPPEVVEVKWVPLEEARTWPLAFHHNEILDAYANRVLSSERREELLAEYDSLRSETLKRIDLRHQSLNLTITAIGIFVAVVASEHARPIALMFYPLLALCIAVAWTQNDMRIGQIGKHVKENIEQQLPGTSWEHSLIERYARLPGIYKRFTELTGFGVFVGTEFIATVSGVLLAIQRSKLLESLPLYILLGLADLIAMWATYRLVHLRRKEHRRRKK